MAISMEHTSEPSPPTIENAAPGDDPRGSSRSLAHAALKSKTVVTRVAAKGNMGARTTNTINVSVPSVLMQMVLSSV